MRRRQQPDTHSLTIQVDQSTSLAIIVASRAMGMTQDEFIAWAVDQTYRQVPRNDRWRRTVLQEVFR